MNPKTLPAGPYIGLKPYSEEEAAFFFGREPVRDIIIANLRSSRLTLIYGASGVGKSSLLRAGVAQGLRRRVRQDLGENGRPKFCVAVFDNWRDDPIAGLANCVRESIAQASDDQTVEAMPQANSLTESFQAWAERAGGDLLIILDQFEDYFLYHGRENGEKGFAYEFARMVNHPDLRVNFLVSIHAGAFSNLERLREGNTNIFNIFDNCLELEHLDRHAAQEAIEKPIERYNHFYATGAKQISIEPALVEEVLKGPPTDEAERVIREKKASTEKEPRIEAPFLQLVMTKLWEAEMLSDSTTLRLKTLAGLGGTKNIVGTHVAQVMARLSWSERRTATGVFHYLVMPSGRKIALSASDLADSANLNQKKVLGLLRNLSGSDKRILRLLAPADHDDEPRYEIFHDVLARPILDWRTRAEERASRDRRLRLWTIAIVLVSLLTGSLLYARGERIRRQAALDAKDRAEEAKDRAEEANHQALQASNVSSQVLAQLYKIVLGSNIPKKAKENADKTLQSLEEVFKAYQQDDNPAGEGIALNNIAGFHRFLGESYSAIADYKRAQEYFKQAQDYYQKALETLKNALGPDHTEVATSLTGQAVVYTDQGNFAEAETRFRQSLEILEKALKPDDRYLADAIMNLAECYNSQGKYDEAESLYKRALEIRKNKLSEDHPERAVSLYGLARLYFERGKYAAAEPLFKQALEIWQRAPKPESRNAAISLKGLSALYRKWGKLDKAVEYSDKAWKIYKDFIDHEPLWVTDHLENVALLHDDLNKKDDAEQSYKKANYFWENGLGKDHPTVAYGRSNLASYYLRNGRPGEAEDFFNKALEIQKALPYSPALAKTVFGLARLYSNQGYYDKAEPLFQQALAIQKKAIPEHPDFAKTLDAYADLLAKTDRNAAADEMKKRAERIRQIHRRENPDK